LNVTSKPDNRCIRDESRLLCDELTDKERFTYFDQDEASIVLVVLAGDADFKAKGLTVAAAPSVERRNAAARAARDYAPYKNTPAHQLIVDLLLVMAEEPWREKGTTSLDFFANLFRPAVWCESPLHELDGRRARARWWTLENGAHALARFGARKCLNCGKALAGDIYERGASRKRSRRTHCEACKAKPRARHLIASQVNAKRQALDAATGQRRRHRAARRAS